MKTKILVGGTIVGIIIIVLWLGWFNIYLMSNKYACTRDMLDEFHLLQLPARSYCKKQVITCEAIGNTYYPAEVGMISTPSVCAKRFDDGGKICKNSEECRGDCFISINTTKGTTTPLSINGQCQEHDKVMPTPGCFIPIEEYDPTKDNMCVWDFV